MIWVRIQSDSLLIPASASRRGRIAPSSTTRCCLSVKTCARIVSSILNKYPAQLFFQVTWESLTIQTTRRRRLQQWGRWRLLSSPHHRPGHSTWADWFPISSVSLITACLEGCNGSNISPLYTRTGHALFKAWCSMCGSVCVCVCVCVCVWDGIWVAVTMLCVE